MGKLAYVPVQNPLANMFAGPGVGYAPPKGAVACTYGALGSIELLYATYCGPLLSPCWY